jgi:hypothetical protein
MNPEAARNFALFRRSGKTGGWHGRLPSPWAVPTVVARLIWPFSLAFERTPLVGRGAGHPKMSPWQRLTHGGPFVGDHLPHRRESARI